MNIDNMQLDGTSPPLRIALISSGDPSDIRTWSGTPYHMLRALQAHFAVTVIRQPFSFWFLNLRQLTRRISRGRIDIYWSRRMTRWGSLKARREIAATSPDIVFTIAISAVSRELTASLPTVHVSDATAALMEKYYPTRSRLIPRLLRNAEQFETDSIKGALISLFPSAWARNSALHDYGADPSRTFEVAWGANLPNSSKPAHREATSTCRILFVGADWHRKGGEIALACARELSRRGFPFRLDIVGCRPPGTCDAGPNVHFHGSLNKQIPQQANMLWSLFENAHMFFLPTLGEALGIVFAEAASFGLPCISYRTGGVSAVIRDGETGILLDPGTSGEAFAAEIIALFNDKGRYDAYSEAARHDSVSRLNWDTWGVTVSAIIRDALERRTKGTGTVKDLQPGV